MCVCVCVCVKLVNSLFPPLSMVWALLTVEKPSGISPFEFCMLIVIGNSQHVVANACILEHFCVICWQQHISLVDVVDC